jgi:hypothetical protein
VNKIGGIKCVYYITRTPPTPFFLDVNIFINMKIIITEQQYTKIQKQQYIDNLLDKINKYGVETLTWNEKEFLEDVENSYSVFSNPLEVVHKTVSILIKHNLVDADKITSNDDEIEIYGLKGVNLPYFEDNYLRIEPSSYSIEHFEGFNIEGVDYGDDIDIEERGEVFNYIEENWASMFAEYDDWAFFFVNDPNDEDYDDE